MTFFGELKRRNVFRVGVAYVLAAWVMLQIIDFVLQVIAAPDWILQVFFLAAVTGLPIALIVSWVFEITPEGVKRESEIDHSQSVTSNTGHKLDRVIIVFLTVAVVLLLTDRLFLQKLDQAEKSSAEMVNPASSLEPAGGRHAAETTATDKNSIAVLPFVNMSSDPEQEYFSDGITEEILNRLAGIRELQVAARTSVFSFKGKNQDVREIAGLLGVGTILEGSVRKSGDQVRITAQLIRASDGFHLWSEAYDRKLENIFAIQDDIANRIAEALQISLGVSSQPAARSSEEVDPEVYDLYLRARALHRNRGEGLLQAIELFEQALAIDPDFAPAWAGLSHSYIVVINYVTEAEAQRLGDVLAKSLAAAETALELDPNLSTALHAMGNNLFFQFEWARAEDYYQRALQLDPDSVEIMEDYASLLLHSWQLEAAQSVVDRMIALDPYVPVFLLVKALLAAANGDFEQRDKTINEALEINPDLRNLQNYQAMNLMQYGDFEEARKYIGQMILSNSERESMLALVDWMSNPEQIPSQTVMDGPSFGEAALMVGHYDFWYLAAEQWSTQFPEWEITVTGNLLAPIASPELMHQYRADPRTKAWLSKVRLPEYWQEVGWPDQCQPVGEDDFECY